MKRQQHRGNHALRHEVGMASHMSSPSRSPQSYHSRTDRRTACLRVWPSKNARAGSATPRRVADASACVWPVKCRVVLLDVVEIDGAERRMRLLQRRASLNPDEIILEIV